MGKMVGPHLLEALPLRSRGSGRSLAAPRLQFPYQLNQCDDDTEQVRTASGQIMNLLLEWFPFQMRLADFVESFSVNDILTACGDDHAPSSFSVDLGVR